MKKSKICKLCNRNLSLNLFGNSKYSEDKHRGWCKNCTNDYQRDLINNNSDYKINQYQSQKKYNHSERGRQSRKKYLQSDKGKEAIRRYEQKYYKSLNGKLASKKGNHKWRAKENNISYSFTSEEYDKKLNSTHGYCQICKEDIGIDNLTMDHIIPISKAKIGSVYTIDDIQFLCRNCNSSKSNKVISNNMLKIDYDNFIKQLSYKDEDNIIKYDKKLYEKIVDIMEGRYREFTDTEVNFLLTK